MEQQKLEVLNLLTSLSNPPEAFRRLLAGPPPPETPSTEPPAPVYQPQTRLTDDERQDLIRRYQAGEKSFQLAIEFGLHRQTAASILVSAGVRRPRLMTKSERTEAARLYQQGWTCARIGEQLGRSRDAVRRALHAAGVQLRHR
jgi:hypothetical protein